jgi:hypothetical protein
MNRILNELLVRRRRANTFSFVVDQHTHTLSRVVIYIYIHT